MQHINTYGSRHTDCIITEDATAAAVFQSQVKIAIHTSPLLCPVLSCHAHPVALLPLSALVSHPITPSLSPFVLSSCPQMRVGGCRWSLLEL
eukprot:751543-Hanusia_phi.AAC.3